jgi:hypothetical protein
MRLLLLLFSFVMIQSAIAQTPGYPKDVQSVDAIIAALYEVISGSADQPRDWERFKNLFAEDARLIPTFKDKEGKAGYRILTPAAYTDMFAKNIKTGFYEGEVSRVTEEYGNIVHVFSTYETREKKDGPVTMRGINSIQLLKRADRYFILHIFWSAENKDNPLPEKYLKK